ncbi:MAG: ATP-binding protein [Sulfuricella sp.]
MRSIRRTLLLWLSAGLFAGIAVAAGLTYYQAREEANELFDYQMKRMAASLPHNAFAPLASVPGDEFDIDEDVVIQIWDKTGIPIYLSQRHPSLPQRAELGFTNVSTPDGVWRVYSAQLGGTVVQVAQPLSARRAIAAQTALRMTLPLLILIPFMGGLIWLAVGSGLAPVRRIAHDVQARDSTSLSPISSAGLPEEIEPLTHALNDLLARLERSIGIQRSFVADAAHELRTPLTALKLQIRMVEHAQDDSERKAAIADLKQGLERASHLVQQLLTLSRQEADVAENAFKRVDLLDIARLVVGEQAPIAAQKYIDLGIEEGTPTLVTGDFEALRMMLGNLVDNAVRYTPAHGRIDVTVIPSAGQAVLRVTDNGEGIPEEDRQRVFDRFYRGEGAQIQQGSGLGLAIVKNIVDRHHGDIALEAGPDGRGLRVTIRFPLAAVAASAE